MDPGSGDCEQTSSPFLGVSHPSVCTNIVRVAVGLGALLGDHSVLSPTIAKISDFLSFCGQKNISLSL